MEVEIFQSTGNCLYPQLCCVCGDIARGINFAVMSCMSCKMFFRRHAQTASMGQKCHYNETCQINKRTRKFCLPCRLKRCYEVGMDPLLIRRSSRPTKPIQLPMPTTLSLLNKDRSTLAVDEWNLLTNIVNTYDEQNLLSHIGEFYKKQFSLPPKLRSKSSSTLTHIAFLFAATHTFIKRCPFFSSLPIQTSKYLIQTNLNLVGSFNAFFMAKQVNIFENEDYAKFVDNIYGNGYINSIQQASERLPQNETLIKITLMIMTFSNSCTVIIYDPLETNHLKCDINMLLYIQNIFITLLWKYLNYQYGFEEAVIKLSSLVKCILDLQERANNSFKTHVHWTMLENVIEQTTRSLHIDNTS